MPRAPWSLLVAWSVACSREPAPAAPLDIRMQISHAGSGFAIALERGAGFRLHQFEVAELDRTVGARASAIVVGQAGNPGLLICAPPDVPMDKLHAIAAGVSTQVSAVVTCLPDRKNCPESCRP